MLKKLDKFVDHIKLLGLCDINEIWIVMHPRTMNEIMNQLGIGSFGRIDFYKGFRLGLDPSVDPNVLTTKYY